MPKKLPNFGLPGRRFLALRHKRFLVRLRLLVCVSHVASTELGNGCGTVCFPRVTPPSFCTTHYTNLHTFSVLPSHSIRSRFVYFLLQ